MAKKALAKELGRPVDTDSEQTRQNILNAAKECFGAQDYSSTSNHDIAKKAGVTAATIYYYFKNKSDLFISVHHECQAKILEVINKRLEQATGLTDALIGISEEVFELYQTDPNIPKFNAVVRMAARRNPEVSEVLYDQEWRNIFHTIAELGIENGELDRAKERECRAVISAITFGLAQHAIESSPSAHKECIQGISDLFRGDLIDATKSRPTTKKKSQ